MTKLQQRYKEEVIPAMRAKFGYKNAMAIPRLRKVVVNTGIGKILRADGKNQEEVEKYLTLITGQKAVPCQARKSIASFKLREGQIIGYKVTLRGQRMHDFLERFISSAAPRMRDFRGFSSTGVDRSGNLTMGIKEHIVFPEMIGEDTRIIFGFEISVVSSAKHNEEAEAFFRLMGFPLTKLDI